MATLINDSFKKVNLPITLGASGVIDTAAATVDIASSFNITSNLPNLTFTLPTPTDVNYSDVVEIGSSNTNTNSFTINGRKVAATSEFAYLRWNGTTWQVLGDTLLNGNLIARTPHNALVETIIAFDGLEIKWHQTGSSFDGIAIRTQAGARRLRYSDVEFYITNAAADGGKSTWGSNNAWYNLPNLGATATIINTTYPYAQNVTTTFLGMGNPALPNADMRIYMLYDDTNQNTYRIYVDKQGSTGEITTAQTGTCYIGVEKLGITTNQILNAGNSIAINSGVIHSTTKANAYFSRSTTSASSTGLDLPMTVNNVIGTDISVNGANTIFTLTPNNGLTKSYKIDFDIKMTFNPILNHSIDFGFVSSGTQTINGIAIGANGQFGSGGSLFSATYGGQEGGSGNLSYIITTAVPISFKIRILGQTNTPTIGNSIINRYPTMTIVEL